MAEPKKIILVVAKTDSTDLLVGGAIDYGISDVIDVDEFNEMVDKMKRAYDPDLRFYDWKEVIITVDEEAILKFFETPEIEAQVEGLDPGYPASPSTEDD